MNSNKNSNSLSSLLPNLVKICFACEIRENVPHNSCKINEEVISKYVLMFYSSYSNLFAANVRYGIAKRVEAVLDVVASLPLQRIVVGSLSISLVFFGGGGGGGQK